MAETKVPTVEIENIELRTEHQFYSDKSPRMAFATFKVAARGGDSKMDFIIPFDLDVTGREEAVVTMARAEFHRFIRALADQTETWKS